MSTRLVARGPGAECHGDRQVAARRINAVHRTSALVLGVGLGVFGVLGLVNRLAWFSTSGASILGLSSNGLLSMVSLVTAAVLIAAGLRGGRTASTVTSPSEHCSCSPASRTCWCSTALGMCSRSGCRT